METGKSQPSWRREQAKMITLERSKLVFRFPDVHEQAVCAIEFQRTLRIPDDERDYPLPPGLGGFPLRHLDDYVSRLPEEWQDRGGVVMPMHQSEAMWINFESDSEYPFAVKISTGKVCAITGDTWVNHLNTDPQDYVVLPEQPWLDGYCVEKGVIRQFVALPLGEGYTVEEQLTGAAEHGGIQIVGYPMKAERYEELIARRADGRLFFEASSASIRCMRAPSMGLAPGGRMKQDIYDDHYGMDVWDQEHASRCFVTITNSVQWLDIIGEPPPTMPPTAKEYTEAGLPWFDYYGGDAKAISGTEKFKGIKSVAQIDADAGGESNENETLDVNHVIRLRGRNGNQVREYTEGELMDS